MNHLLSTIPQREAVLPKGARATSKIDLARCDLLIDKIPIDELTLGEFKVRDIVKKAKFDMFAYNSDRSKSVGVVFVDSYVILRQKLNNIRRVIQFDKNEYNIQDLFPFITFEILENINDPEEFRRSVSLIINGRNIKIGILKVINDDEMIKIIIE